MHALQVWQFGMLMWEVWECRRVYDGRSYRDVLRGIIGRDFQLPAPTGCLRRYINLLNACREPVPANRFASRRCMHMRLCGD